MTQTRQAQAAFIATSKTVPQLVNSVAAQVADLGLTERQLFRVQLTLEELVLNALEHGGRAELSVSVTLVAFPEKLRLTLEDDGAPFDLCAAPPREMEETVEAAQPGGWGLELVRRFAHSVTYRRAGDRNIVVLEFTP